jgi:hypothetical protein
MLRARSQGKSRVLGDDEQGSKKVEPKARAAAIGGTMTRPSRILPFVLASFAFGLASVLVSPDARAESHDIAVVAPSSPASAAMSRELAARGFHVVHSPPLAGGCWGAAAVEKARAVEVMVCLEDDEEVAVGAAPHSRALVFVGDGTKSRHTDTLTLDADPDVSAIRTAEVVRVRMDDIARRAAAVPARTDAQETAVKSAPPWESSPAEPATTTPRTTHAQPSIAPLVVAGIGAATTIAGVTTYLVGHGNVPSGCDFDSRTCSPGTPDDVKTQASNATNTAKIGEMIGIGGGFVLAGGLVWLAIDRWAPRAPAAGTTTRIVPQVGLGTIGVAGTF